MDTINIFNWIIMIIVVIFGITSFLSRDIIILGSFLLFMVIKDIADWYFLKKYRELAKESIDYIGEFEKKLTEEK